MKREEYIHIVQKLVAVAGSLVSVAGYLVHNKLSPRPKADRRYSEASVIFAGDRFDWRRPWNVVVFLDE